MRNTKKYILLFGAFVVATFNCFAQVGIGTTTPHSSTALDIVSNHSGLTVPRLTTLERDNNISSPTNGLIIMNLDEDCLQIFKTSLNRWVSLFTKEDEGKSLSFFGLNVRDFGAKGNNNHDDTLAFQQAIDSAMVTGNRVLVPAGNYIISSTLLIKKGVNLVGVGPGSTPLQTPYNGSSIRYTGTDNFAVKIIGHSSGIRDIVLFDVNQGANGSGGIQVIGDGAIVESVRLFNVQIIYFLGGTGLQLSAKNSGGVSYLTSYNTRIRHAKVGIHIVEDNTANSFTNSNVFHHGAISGSGFDNGILIDGGNNNQFYGTIIEPPSSEYGHLVVNKGEIRCNEIRIEGNSQNNDSPLLHFKEDTFNSIITGTFAGGLVTDEGNNTIDFRSGKSAFYRDSRNNLFENATFNGLNNNILPYWDITGNPSISIDSNNQLFTTHRVLKLDASSTVFLKPIQSLIPKIGSHPSYKQLTIGMYVKTNLPNVFIRTNTPNGVTTSNPHPGDDEWHFISMANLVNTSVQLDAKLEINGSGTVYVTAPTMSFGSQAPEITPKPITSGGGIITGTLSFGSYEYTPTSTYVVLPKEGNLFFINGTQQILRINHLTSNRFVKGTIITLIFNNAGVLVTDSGYINLLSNFTSTINSSLQLLSLGDGTWLEVNRNL